MAKDKTKFHGLKIFGIAIVFAFLIRFLVLGVYKIPTSAMLPSLYMGDIVIGWKFPFHPISAGVYQLLIGDKAKLRRGDLIVFKHPDGLSRYVKRVIALPGDKINFVSRNEFQINGKSAEYSALDEELNFIGSEYYDLKLEKLYPYANKVLLRKSQEEKALPIEVVVPLGTYYVLGDNRDVSDDSRDWGVIPASNVEAVVRWVFLSVDWQQEKQGKLRTGRFLLPLSTQVY